MGSRGDRVECSGKRMIHSQFFNRSRVAMLAVMICLPAARGERNDSAADEASKNAATTAPRIRTLVFISIFFLCWAPLDCGADASNTPAQRKSRKKKSRPGSGFAGRDWKKKLQADWLADPKQFRWRFIRNLHAKKLSRRCVLRNCRVLWRNHFCGCSFLPNADKSSHEIIAFRRD